MEQAILTNFGNLSYTARRAVGYDLKSSMCIYWRVGAKEAKKICTGLGISFYMSVNGESMVDGKYERIFRELEREGKVKVRMK